MAILIVEHDVNDFNNWKPVYEGNQPLRDQYGLTNARVYKLDGNANRVCVIFDGEADKIQQFVNDPGLKQAMDKAGVVGEPNIMILDNATVTV